MAQPRTQKGAIKKELAMLEELKDNLKMAWTKNNPEQYTKDTLLEIKNLKDNLKINNII